MKGRGLDRLKKPAFEKIKAIPFEMPGLTVLGNGTSLYALSDPDSEVLRIEFRYNAGRAFSIRKLDAYFANELITAGTSTMSEQEISERIDFYGAYFEKDIGDDDASFTIYTLKKYAAEILEIVSAVLNDPVYPESEVNLLRTIRKKKFEVKCRKVDFLARREFMDAIFGSHPYGRKTELEDFDKLTQKDVADFHGKYYRGKPLIMAAGNAGDDVLKLIEKHFGNHSFGERSGEVKIDPVVAKPKENRIVVEKQDSVQCAIRMGRIMFNRTHADFAPMQLLITVLGGYFGSRLMSNLREDKGYTYGVNASLASLRHGGFFYIETEVGADSVAMAETEIRKELEILTGKAVDKSELELVKNYLLGLILRSTDGVFARMDRFKLLHSFGQDADDFHKLVSGILEARPDKLRELAAEWFNPSEMVTVIAGKV